MSTPAEHHDPYRALRLRDYRHYAAGSFLATVGGQMQTVAIGWELYERTNEPIALGYVGLVQFLPVLLLTLPAGHVADRLDRRRIVVACQCVLALCSLGLAALSFFRGPVAAMYVLLAVTGMARAFNSPARSALLPQIIPPDTFSNAVTWNSSFGQVASMVGPALGGLLIGWMHRASLVYVVDAVCILSFAVAVSTLRVHRESRPMEAISLQSLAAGMTFVWRTRVILAAITLDLFAVLLGGATMLLPIYAKDILQVGPEGLGWLRAAPSVGAFVVALTLAHRPPMVRAGRALLLAVAGFGLATIVFGLSRSFLLSLCMLALLGATDTVSVVIRHSLVQMWTPDALRGRVSAVNSLFIGSSNELGGFESGLVAQLFGPVASVVAGGVGTILVVLTVAARFPEVRRLKGLTPERE